ncbi:MAG TPA: 6-carboxytetrahydropterin synthase [Opitutus sp.]|nr:6-carboxytetrahydropterin synthase [Opitutus sp.]
MPFRICKSFEIESGHMLSKHPGPCRFPHGHSRRIEVVLVADRLDANDMVCDFKALKGALQALLDTWDHALCLNTADPQFAHLASAYGERVVPFTATDPTSEVMARTVFESVKRRLQTEAENDRATFRIPPGVRVERVRVTETSSSWAEYFE